VRLCLNKSRGKFKHKGTCACVKKGVVKDGNYVRKDGKEDASDRKGGCNRSPFLCFYSGCLLGASGPRSTRDGYPG
jgi:hypothetical protein